MTKLNMGAKMMIIAGEVYDFEEAKEIEGIAKVVVLMRRIRKISRSEKH